MAKQTSSSLDKGRRLIAAGSSGGGANFED
jgi:hypothetical protein